MSEFPQNNTDINDLLTYSTPSFEPVSPADKTEAGLQLQAYHSGYTVGVMAMGLIKERWRSEAKDQEIARLRALAAAATYNEALAENFRREAEIDQKVGLLNHPAFIDRVRRHVGHSQRGTDRGATNFLMIVDIDNFKHHVNDTFGHPFGDSILAAVAERLRRNIREEDEVGRYGGEEFIAFFRRAPEDAALKVADRFRDSLHEISFRKLAREHNLQGVRDECLDRGLTVSIGLAELPQGGDIATATQSADQALYHVKQNGRNAVAVNYGSDIVICQTEAAASI